MNLMQRFSRTRDSQQSTEMGAMSFNDQDGQPLLAFPPTIVGTLRHMMTRMSQQGKLPRRLALTSALSGEGVTFITHALGTIMANDLRARVCVVDMNWWSEQPPILAAANGGLAAAMTDGTPLEEVIVSTGQPNLDVIGSGDLLPVNRPVVARSQTMQAVLDELGEKYDYLLLDVPAILKTSDAIALAAHGEACALVVHQGVTPIHRVRVALDDISHLTIAGVVMNQVKTRVPDFLLRFFPQV